MPSIPLALASYERTDLPPTLLKNRYFERAPTNLEDGVALHPRPRLKLFSTAGSGPINGMYREGGVLSGVSIVLSGSQLYKVTSAGVATTIGAVIDGSGGLSAEGTETAVILCNGTSAYTTDGSTRTAISIPSSLSVNAVDTLDQRFLFAINASNVFYWSDVGDPTTVGALSFASAESQPDVLITLKVVDDVLWLIGRLSLEAWRPTGDADLPYERIEGRVFGIGATAKKTVQKMNVDGTDTMCWVGTDRKVYRLNPNPERISDFGLEERLARATPEDLYGHSTSWNGHDFYILHIPGEGSFAYDLTTKKGWAEWTSYGASLFRTSASCTGPNAQPLLGDFETGAIYELSEDEITDTASGDPVNFEAMGILEVVGAPQRMNNLIATVTTGNTDDIEADPVMQLAISDDHGETWDAQPDQPLGRQGYGTERVMWTRLGMLRRERGRLLRLRTTQPTVIQKLKYNEPFR